MTSFKNQILHNQIYSTIFQHFCYKDNAISFQRCYPMFSKPRGYALIINNESFVNDIYKYRTGSTIDANNLDILFEQLGFKVR